MNENLTVVIHNAAFETMFFYALGCVPQCKIYDTLAAAQMTLKNETEFRKLSDSGLKKLAPELLGIELPSFEYVTDGKFFDELSSEDFETIRYACADSDYALQLYYLFNKWFDENMPKHRFIVEQIESPTTVYVGLMKYNGVPLDLDLMHEKGIEAGLQIDQLKEDIAIMNLIESKSIDADKIFSKENMKLCAWAKISMPAEYAKLKAKFKGKVNLRDFEKAVKYEGQNNAFNAYKSKNKALMLEDIQLNGAIMPQGWNVTMSQGIQKESVCKDSSTIISVCKSPVIITKRLENFDDGSEKVELSFFRDGRWKKLIAARSSVFNRNSIIKYADSGLPISSSSAAELVAYLSDYENANIDKILLVRSIARVGWLDNRLFFPYCTQKEIIFESESSEANGIIDAAIPYGSMDIWKKYAIVARKNPFARFILSASFASPLLKLLDSRVFFIHIWHDSQSGKTAVMKFAVSVWGDASKLMGSFNATSVGLERMAGILKHLPFAMDTGVFVATKTVECKIFLLGRIL